MGAAGGAAAAPMRVRTDWPCSNCTRAITSRSPAAAGFSVSRISLDVSAARLPRSQTICGSCAAGSGDARTTAAVAGAGTRTCT